MKSAILCKAAEFNQPDWRFLNLLKSANQYGLVEDNIERVDKCPFGFRERSGSAEPVTKSERELVGD